MALYGRDPIPDNLADLFSDSDFGLLASNSGSPHLPYSKCTSSRGVSGAPQHNALERGARSLPRPKRRRKQRKPEVSLYPSLSAIEDCIPDTEALDFGVSTSADSESSKINTSSSSSSCSSSISDSSSCCSSQASSCTSGTTSLLRHPSKSYSRKGHDGDDPLDSLMAPSRSGRAPQAPSRHYSSKSSALSIANHSVGSSSSGGSRELERDFKRISLTSNKRKPASRCGSVDTEEGKGLLVPEAPTSNNEKAAKEDGHYIARGGDWRSSSSSSQESEKTSKYYPSKDDALYKKNDWSSQGSDKSYKSYPPYAPSDARNGISGTGSEEKDYYKRYSKSGNKGPSTFGSLIRSVRDDYMDDAQEQPLPGEELTPASVDKRGQHLEIEPGLLLPLRGADETVTSIKAGFVESVYCQACDNELLCIADATFCVCPDCKCISAVSGAVSSLAANTDTHKLYPEGSVGLGFRRNHRRAVS